MSLEIDIESCYEFYAYVIAVRRANSRPSLSLTGNRVLFLYTVNHRQFGCGVLAEALKGLKSRYNAPLPPAAIRPGLAPVAALSGEVRKDFSEKSESLPRHRRVAFPRGCPLVCLRRIRDIPAFKMSCLKCLALTQGFQAFLQNLSSFKNKLTLHALLIHS